MQYETNPLNNTPSAKALREIDTICDSYEADFGNGIRRDILTLVESANPNCRDLLLYELMLLELELKYGNSWSTRDLKPIYSDRYKAYRNVIEKVFNRTDSTTSGARKIRIRCPKCQNAVEIEADASFDDINCKTCGSNFSILDNQTKAKAAAPVSAILHFELIKRIGIGGFGTVWKAHDKKLDREVAVKIPRRGQLQPEEEEQFLREARAAAQLSHPNIVSVHEVGRDPDADTVFIVSDIVRGIPLSDWLTSGIPTTSETVTCCIKIADALHHAHESGVIHRDLKPHNIILDEKYEPFLTDFGLAKREYGELTVTMDGQLLGTPAYMSPEQASGNAHQADNRTDIYSMGVMLFQLLTGELPFRGNARMVMHQVLNTEPPSPRTLDSTIPRDLETICLKCLDKSPEGRYQTAKELADDLRRYSRREPILARPVGPLEKGWRWCQRNTMLASSIAFGLLLLTLLTVGSIAFAVTVSQNRKQLREQLTNNLIHELKLKRQARNEAYRDEVKGSDTFQQILALGGESVHHEQLVQLSVNLLGDFVGIKPIVHDSFDREIQTVAIHPTGSMIAVLYKDGSIESRDPLTTKSLGRFNFQASGEGHDLRFSTDGNEIVGIFKSELAKLRANEDGTWEELNRKKLDQPELSWARFSELGKSFVRWSETKVQLQRTANAELVSTLDTNRLMREVFGTEGSAEKNLEVKAVAYSDTHDRLAICYDLSSHKAESGLIVWDPSKDELIKKVEINQGTPYGRSVQFGPSGATFAVGTDRALEIYDLPDFRRRFSGRTGTIKCVTFSSDGHKLCSVGMHGKVTLWDVYGGGKVAQLSLPQKGDTSSETIAISQDLQLMVASNHHLLKVWKIGQIPERKSYSSHDDGTTSVDFSSDGQLLLTGSKDNSVRIYRVGSPIPIEEMKMSGEVQSARFSPDGKTIAVAIWGEANSAVELWDIALGKRIARCHHELDTVFRLTHIDDSYIAASCRFGLAVWKTDSVRVGQEVASLRPSHLLSEQGVVGKCFGVTASHDGRRLAFAERLTYLENEPIRIRTWEWKTAKVAEDVSESAPDALHVWHSVAFASKGYEIVYADKKGRVQWWDTQNKTLKAVIGDEELIDVSFLASSPDGKWLAVMDGVDTVAIINLKEKRKEFTLPKEGSDVYALAWHPDSNRLAVGANNGEVVVWNIAQVQKQAREIRAGKQQTP